MPAPRDDVSPLGVHLRRARRARGLTQAALADLLGVRQGQVSSWEGPGGIRADSLRRILEVLEVPEDEWSEWLQAAGER